MVPTGKRHPPLTDDEVGEVRKLIQNNDRKDWFWRGARTVALWVSAVIAGANYGWDALGKIIRYFSGNH